MNKFDEFLRRQIYIERYKSGEANRMLKQIRSVDREVHRIIKRLPLDPSDQAIDAVMRIISKKYVDIYKKIYNNSKDKVENLLLNDVRWLQRVTNITPKSLSRVIEEADATPYKNLTMDKWFRGLAKKRINLIRQGLSSARTKAQRNTEFTKAVNLTNNHTRTLSNTLINHYLNLSRERHYSSDKLIWISILDSSTTTMCAVRSRRLYDAQTHQPINHNIPWNGGPGVIHFNCRSIALPFEDHESVNEYGEVYEDWLRNQPRSIVEEILGKKKADLFLAGLLALGAFVVASGEEITLEELEQQYEVAN